MQGEEVGGNGDVENEEGDKCHVYMYEVVVRAARRGWHSII